MFGRILNLNLILLSFCWRKDQCSNNLEWWTNSHFQCSLEFWNLREHNNLDTIKDRPIVKFNEQQSSLFSFSQVLVPSTDLNFFVKILIRVFLVKCWDSQSMSISLFRIWLQIWLNKSKFLWRSCTKVLNSSFR